jgi:hypothetical protein
MPTEKEAMPLAEYLVKVGGVDPAKAAVLGAQGEALGRRSGAPAPPSAAALQALEGGSPADARQRGAIASSALERAPDPAPPPPRGTVTRAQAQEALEAHEAARAAVHLDQVFAESPMHYRVPASSEQPSDEALAADAALTQMLHAERTPRDLGEAIMQDIAAARVTPKSAETLTAVRPWVDQMLRTARANPTLRPYVQDVSVERFLDVLSPETIVALSPFVKYRAGRR